MKTTVVASSTSTTASTGPAAASSPVVSSGTADAATLATLSAAPEWAAKSDNPPLCGNFAPVDGECTLSNLRVEGELPSSLDGVYLRNGPNPAHEPYLGAHRYHWFDGDGMVHWLRLQGGRRTRRSSSSSSSSSSSEGDDEEEGEGRDANIIEANEASYGRRYIRTRGFQQEEAAGRALYTGLRDINPIWNVLLPRLVKKIAEWRAPDSPFWVVQSKNTANNGLKYHAGRLLATYESAGGGGAVLLLDYICMRMHVRYISRLELVRVVYEQFFFYHSRHSIMKTCFVFIFLR